MADKKLGLKLPSMVQRYDTDTALFGTQVTKAWRIMKEVLNGKDKKKDEPSSPH